MKNAPRKMGRPKNFNQDGQKITIQALDRALDVLEALSRANGMTLSDLAEHLDQSTATMYRVLHTLEAREIIELDMQTQAWHIGPMAFRLGSSFLRRSSIIERSRPIMRDLMAATGETANLGIERNLEVVFVGQVETHESIRAFFRPGTVSPMHASGIGKALLSCFDETQIDGYLKNIALTKFTAQTIVNAQALKADLAETKARGWSYDNEERTEGMRCIASPIFNSYGESLAGISVSGPSSRMHGLKIERLGQLVREAAERVSHDLGHSG